MADETQEMDETKEEAVVVREGVSLPGWLAGALVVVAALAIGGVGYAIGNSDSNRGVFDPVANLEEARGGGQLPGGPGGLPGHPRGPGSGGPGMRGGGGECGPGQRGDKDGRPDDRSGDERDDSRDDDPLSPDDQGAAF